MYVGQMHNNAVKGLPYKEYACNAGDLGQEDSPGEGKGNSLH